MIKIWAGDYILYIWPKTIALIVILFCTDCGYSLSLWTFIVSFSSMCHSLAAIFFSDCTYIRTDETASVDGFDSFKNWFQFQQNKRENQFQQNKRENQFQFLKSFTQQMDSFENEVRTETGFDVTKTLTITAYLLYQNQFRFPKLSVPMVSTVSHKPKLVLLISKNGQFHSSAILSIFWKMKIRCFYDIVVMFSFIGSLKGVTVNTLKYPHSNTIKINKMIFTFY